LAKLRWDEVALRARSYVLCRDDDGFSLVADGGTAKELEVDGKRVYWPTLGAINKWLEAQSPAVPTTD
jgi:hypothetical protein